MTTISEYALSSLLLKSLEISHTSVKYLQIISEFDYLSLPNDLNLIVISDIKNLNVLNVENFLENNNSFDPGYNINLYENGVYNKSYYV